MLLCIWYESRIVVIMLIWPIVLLALTILIFIIPFVPTIREFLRKTDCKPLDVGHPEQLKPKQWLEHFKTFIHTNFSDLQNINHSSCFIYPNNETKTQTNHLTIAINHKMVLSNNIKFTNRIYSTEEVITGENNIIQEIFTEGSLTIKQNSNIVKAAYSGSEMIVNRNCHLGDYAIAKQKIVLNENTLFHYLEAPAIYFEICDQNPLQMVSFEPSDLKQNLSREISWHKYFIKPNSQLQQHLVIKNSLSIAANCNLVGNIKSYKSLIVASNTKIHGALFSKTIIDIANACQILGPIIATKEITIGNNCQIGTPQQPTSIVATKITIGKGTVIFGMILAKEIGHFL